MKLRFKEDSTVFLTVIMGIVALSVTTFGGMVVLQATQPGTAEQALVELESEVPQTVLIELREGTQGEESSSCGCESEYNPVCSVTGVTHDNACISECLGDGVAYEGLCQTEDGEDAWGL